jgi:DNA-directed RNA polymerase omega subunit
MVTLMERESSRYKLVVLAAKRALELSEGKDKLVEVSPHMKLSNVAIKEIQEGKIGYKVIEEGKTS